MKQKDKDRIKKARHVWTTRDVELGNSGVVIPEGTEGVLLAGSQINGGFIVWFYSMGKDPVHNMAYEGIVPVDSIRW